MSKLNFRSLKSIIVAPGDISYNFINGRQVSLWTPVILFLIANAIYLLINTPSDLYTHLNNRPYSRVAKEAVDKKIRANKTTLIKFEEAYDQRSTYVGKPLLFLTVFFFSFALYFVNFRRNLKYIDHLAVSFEFMTLATLYILIIMSWVDVLILTFIVVFLLLYAFERMTYRHRPFRSMANAAILVFLFYATLLLYRSAVFFVTMYTM